MSASSAAPSRELPACTRNTREARRPTCIASTSSSRALLGWTLAFKERDARRHEGGPL